MYSVVVVGGTSSVYRVVVPVLLQGGGTSSVYRVAIPWYQFCVQGGGISSMCGGCVV